MSISKILNSLEKSWERDDILLNIKKGLGTDEIVNEFLIKNERQIKELNSLLRPEDIDFLNQVEQLSTCESQLINKIKNLNYKENNEKDQISISSVKPGLTGIGSIIFRNEEEILQRSDQNLEKYYSEYITPFKAKLENWYLINKSFYTDIKLIFLTAWVIIFKNSKLPHKFFSDLPRNELLTKGLSFP